MSMPILPGFSKIAMHERMQIVVRAHLPKAIIPKPFALRMLCHRKSRFPDLWLFIETSWVTISLQGWCIIFVIVWPIVHVWGRYRGVLPENLLLCLALRELPSTSLMKLKGIGVVHFRCQRFPLRQHCDLHGKSVRKKGWFSKGITLSYSTWPASFRLRLRRAGWRRNHPKMPFVQF